MDSLKAKLKAQERTTTTTTTTFSTCKTYIMYNNILSKRDSKHIYGFWFLLSTTVRVFDIEIED